MKILSYILLSSLLIFVPAKALAQEKAESDSTQNYGMFTFKGINVSTDIFGYAYSMLEDYISGEVAVEVNLGNKFYPVFEVGYGSSDVTDETNGIHYKSSAPYYRVGLNYNFSNKVGEAPKNNYIYGLARYGWSNMKYDVSAPPITDPVWGGEVPLNLTDVKGGCNWFEIGAGVNVKIWKHLRMGWSIRYKARISRDNGPNSNVWYIPGFGNSRHTTFGATYNIIYEIPM